ncbi:hypothetical protein D3C77_653320 [compost metagenome]
MVCTLVSKLHMLELHFARCSFQPYCLPALIVHFLCLQKFKDTLAGRRSRLQALRGLGDLREGLGKETDIHHKGENHTERNISVRCKYGANHPDGHEAQISDKHHDRHHQAGKELGLEYTVFQITV